MYTVRFTRDGRNECYQHLTRPEAAALADYVSHTFRITADITKESYR